jgi:hypothetical protein
MENGGGGGGGVNVNDAYDFLYSSLGTTVLY